MTQTTQPTQEFEPYADEAQDPDALSAAEADAMLEGAPWTRYVVVGDSTAYGVGEPVEGYAEDNWGARVAGALRRQNPGFEYLNLGERDLFVAQVREAQLERALAFKPDLATVLAGGNDLLRKRFEPDALRAELEAMVTAFTAIGADVLMFTMMDITRALPMPKEFGDRITERLNAMTATIADVSAEHDLLLVDMAAHHRSADPRVYASDFKHLSNCGHAVVGSCAIRRLAEAIS